MLMMTVAVTAQKGFKKDSLQFKVYTKIYVNHNKATDSITLERVFFDYCNNAQKKLIAEDALRQTEMMVNYPEYREQGIHKIALFVRYRKDEFRKVE